MPSLYRVLPSSDSFSCFLESSAFCLAASAASLALDLDSAARNIPHEQSLQLSTIEISCSISISAPLLYRVLPSLISFSFLKPSAFCLAASAAKDISYEQLLQLSTVRNVCSISISTPLLYEVLPGLFLLFGVLCFLLRRLCSLVRLYISFCNCYHALISKHWKCVRG